MSFPYGKEPERALKDVIKESIEQRKIDACDSWNIASVLASAWGVKEDVNPEKSEEVRKTFKDLEGKTIELETGEEVEILKGDVKERKGKHTLIFRYKLNN